MNAVTVLVTDDNPIVRGALCAVLAGEDDIEVVGEAVNGVQALDLARAARPRVTLLDYRMPVADGLDVVAELSQYTSILALTSDDSTQVITAMLRGGARGYLVHGQFDPPDLVRAVRAVAAGQGWLSPAAATAAAAALREHDDREQDDRDRLEGRRADFARRTGLTAREREILTLLGEGLSNVAIGQRLGLTEKTVKNHLSSVFSKIHVTSRTEAAVRWSTPS
ncbi:LuxR C-terminal-related transcriptional regulator [Dactylosporangium sp. CA-233914]|uniref:LuxR C-terminal-related transcriptional regulator n=1 Tax=Dactylosporangium sp. CA-233914 TaxID=3239934 RepID=UPI003D8F82AE